MVKSQEERSADDVAVSINLIGDSRREMLPAPNQAPAEQDLGPNIFTSWQEDAAGAIHSAPNNLFRPEHSHLRIFDPHWPFDIIARLGGFPHLRLNVAKFLLAARLIAAAVGPLLMAIGPTSFRLLRVSIAGLGVGVIGSSRLIANGRGLHCG
jgi:hypothetical protein